MRRLSRNRRQSKKSASSVLLLLLARSWTQARRKRIAQADAGCISGLVALCVEDVTIILLLVLACLCYLPEICCVAFRCDIPKETMSEGDC